MGDFVRFSVQFVLNWPPFSGLEGPGTTLRSSRNRPWPDELLTRTRLRPCQPARGLPGANSLTTERGGRAVPMPRTRAPQTSDARFATISTAHHEATSTYQNQCKKCPSIRASDAVQKKRSALDLVISSAHPPSHRDKKVQKIRNLTF